MRCWEENLLRVLKESGVSGKMPTAFMFTSIALVPKFDNPISSEEFKPISLCNCIYKISSKVIAKWIKALPSRSILQEQFK